MLNFSKLHKIFLILVLWCYFIALTPLHSLWHLLEEQYYTEKRYSVTEEHTTSSLECSFCDIILNQQNGHLVSSEVIVDFSFFLPVSSEEDFFYTNVIGISVEGNPLLRAPPFI